jgi:hypothetical protein
MSDSLFVAAAVPAYGAAPVVPGTTPGVGGSEIAFPFQVTPHGRVATVGYEAHVEQMIEQVLFTSPGERVNRPDFGCGVLSLVFAGESSALVTATQFLVQGSLQRWLGDVIVVSGVLVTAVESTFSITVQYTLRETGAARSATFVPPGAA